MSANLETKLREGFYNTAAAIPQHLKNHTKTELDAEFHPLFEAIATHGLIPLFTTDRYDQDLQGASRNAMRRPFGIVLNTLSPSIQLLLYPEIVYKPIAEDRTIAKEEGLEVRTKGPQAMLYVLDEYAGEVGQVENLTANIIFSGHMADAALNNRFPFKTGERSSEFQKAVKEAFEKAQRYVLALEEESRGKLLPRISKLGDLNEIALKQTARNFVLYEVEPLKTQGLIEVPLKDDINLSPADAIATGQTYLHCDERELPFINPLGDSSYTGVHAEAWSEIDGIEIITFMVGMLHK